MITTVTEAADDKTKSSHSPLLTQQKCFLLAISFAGSILKSLIICTIRNHGRNRKNETENNFVSISFVPVPYSVEDIRKRASNRVYVASVTH